VWLRVKDDRMTAVARLREAHGDAAFPDRLRSADIAGVEMVMLDADVAACVGIWPDAACLVEPASFVDVGRQLPMIAV
jgi:hypothetical protein